MNWANYGAWQETADPGESTPEGEEVVVIPERKSGKGKICPECKVILIPSKVGRGHSFRIDRCGQCGGFWFDRNEWEALRGSGLHRDIHEMATVVWQRNIRKDEMRQIMEKIYRERFDEGTLRKLTEIHAWIHAHPQKKEVLSYLLDEDPYKL